MNQRKSWTRDELMVAMNLYCKLPFGRLNDTTPEIVAVARRMSRTPGSLTMKLCNLASFDPANKDRGVKGLRNASRADRQIWDEFHADWSALGLESEKLYQTLVAGADPLVEEAMASRKVKSKRRIVMPKALPSGVTEVEMSITARRGQDFFRKAVLASYDCQCCITGNPVPELLNASHIKPWRDFPKERLNPANGLCLAKTYDAAFDAGLISFDGGNRLVISKYIEDYLPSEAIEREFMACRGRLLRLPEKFQPESGFLAWHREAVFRG